MGYEVTIHVMQPGHRRDELGTYGMDIATVELCKPGHKSATCKLCEKPAPDPMAHAYFYGSDGNTVITHDRYEKRLYWTPLADVVDALREDAKNDNYRRFRIALKTMAAVQEEFGDNASCILFGH